MTADQLVGGRYLLGAPLGRGGMAQVHRASDQRLGREVAVKQLSAHLAADPTAQTRFRREAQAAASLNHPAIAAVFDTGEDTDPATGISIPYIVMELVEGQTLRALLDGGLPLPPERALRIIDSVLDALGQSHAAGIIHRDIKPANVMLTTTGAVKVMDFGIARAVDDTSASLTQTAAVIGTAQYLSPEQAAGRSVDQRSDLYAVGCLLFELLVGRPPFVGESSISIAYQHVREEPVAPSTLNPALAPALDAVVLHALTKDPDERYPSAAAMKADVARLLADPTDAALAAGAEATRLRPTVALAAPTAGLAAVPGTAVPADPTATSVAVPVAAPLPAAAAPDGPAPRRSGAARGALVAVAVFLLLGLGAYGLFRVLGPTTSGSAAVTVPDVVGSTRAEAERALRDVDLVPRVEDVRGEDGQGRGTVLTQTPEGGTGLAAQGVVVLRVGAGTGTARIPGGLVGEDVDEVRDELAAAGFTSVRVDEVPSPTDDDEQGEVLAVDPGEGEEVALDEDVVLRYASGRVARGGATTGPDEGDGAAPAPTRSPGESSAPAEPSATREPTGGPTGDDDDATTAPPSASSGASSSSDPAATPDPESSRTTEEPEQEGRQEDGEGGGDGRGRGDDQGKGADKGKGGDKGKGEDRKGGGERQGTSDDSPGNRPAEPEQVT